MLTLHLIFCAHLSLISFITYPLHQLNPYSGFRLYHSSKSSPPKWPFMSLYQSVADPVVSLLSDFPCIKRCEPLSPWNSILLNFRPPHSLRIFLPTSLAIPGSSVAPVPPYAPCIVWFLTAWPSTPLFSLQGLCLGAPSTLTPPNTSWELMSLKRSFSPHHLPAPHSRVSAGPHDLSRSQTRLAHSLLHPCVCEWATPRAHLPS